MTAQAPTSLLRAVTRSEMSTSGSRRGEWCRRAGGSDVSSAIAGLMIVGLFPQTGEGDTTLADRPRRRSIPRPGRKADQSCKPSTTNKNPPQDWPVFPQITKSIHAASDHAAVWIDLDLWTTRASGPILAVTHGRERPISCHMAARTRLWPAVLLAGGGVKPTRSLPHAWCAGHKRSPG
jgi:hypothetical protein